jgi:hypothetical protein
MKIKTPAELRNAIRNLVDKAVDYEHLFDEDAIQALESVQQERWRKFTLACDEIAKERRRKTKLRVRVVNNN